MRRFLLSLLASFLAAPAAHAQTGLSLCRTWAVFYGQSAPAAALQKPDVVVLEPDHAWQPQAWRRPGQKVLAYLSMGEVHQSRAYFKALQDAGALAAANPDWPDARRIDVRSHAWSDRVLEVLAPDILDQGYDGFFLDTLDAAEAMEAHFPGARQAMGALVLALKAHYPKALLMANGGTALLPQMAPALDALATESVFTDYQFRPARYQGRATPQAAERAAYWQGLSARYGLPVFLLEYAERDNQALRQMAVRQGQEAGFVPFVAEIGLGAWEEMP